MGKDKEPKTNQVDQGTIEDRKESLSQEVIARRIRKLKKYFKERDEAQSPRNIQKILNTVIDK